MRACVRACVRAFAEFSEGWPVGGSRAPRFHDGRKGGVPALVVIARGGILQEAQLASSTSGMERRPLGYYSASPAALWAPVPRTT